MGCTVIASADHNTSPNYVVTPIVPPSAGAGVGDGELGIWVGNLVHGLNAATGIQRCLQALREAHWPNPITEEVSIASWVLDDPFVRITNGAAPTPPDNAVAIVQGLDFVQAGDSNSGHIRRMFGAYLEVMKAESFEPPLPE